MKKGLIMGALMVGATLFAVEKSDPKELLRAKVESGKYRIEINRAIPRRGSSVNLTSLYSLRVSGDTIDSYLPYYGRAYSLPYGGGQGLIFKGIATEYTAKQGKKGEMQIEFKVSSDDDRFKYSISLFPGGSATVNVMPNNREGITYYGTLEME